jgi:hypothetical protein
MSLNFQNPPETPINQYQMDDIEQAAFPEQLGNESAASAYPNADQYTGIPENLVQMKAEIASQLARMVGSASAQELYSAQGMGNIVGVGLGTSESPASLSAEPGSTGLNIYVVEPTSIDEVKAVLVDSMGVSAASSDNVPVNVIVTGIIDAQQHRFKMRPAPGGISIGHPRVTAGTLGCLAYRPNRVLVLSNNHVIANSNDARFGDHITQPGRVDGGVAPADTIAILERFVPINFAGACNYVDCATGWAWPDRVRKELVYLRGGKPDFFNISSLIRTPVTGMIVGKSGRTTQLTQGRITDTSVTVRVNYGAGRVALFCDQIAVRGLSGDFSAGGDSGSVIWTWDNQRNPVGLLFAGGGGITFANKMGRVLSALDIRLYT